MFACELKLWHVTFLLAQLTYIHSHVGCWMNLSLISGSLGSFLGHVDQGWENIIAEDHRVYVI